jgi:glycosyltransferase involved in cell wall biosynthesis
LERSLSILLPVQNAQASLQLSVARLLEAASELTDKFEILIVDEGSADHTDEIARELATIYPQVNLLSHAVPRGTVEVIRRGLARTSGEIVCLHEGQGEVDLSDLRELWKLRDQEDLIVARHERRRILGRSGFQMLRRSAAVDLQENAILSTSSNQVRLLRADRGMHANAQMQRPNIFTKLRNLALGE